ncbi:hypothetical protein C1D09_017165 [Mesorhizobium intechi]|uniref:Uncharacterized protein n=1 Tax=Mesorhizobium intechi TaxID=537601 RepID=A0A8T9AQD5_9HYPH|nr:hypothetical protein [Mesorhizobium intechi]TSE08692.1 hypothetical protein C1D09_017165 [Mesorhizobium intechi]
MESHDELEQLATGLTELKGRFEQAGRRYLPLARQASKQAADEVWSRSPVYSALPLGIEREYRHAPGRPLTKRPKRLAASLCARLDGMRRVICIDDYVSHEARYEEYWEYGPNTILTTCYDYYEPADNVINVQTVVMEAGRPRAFLRYARVGTLIELYRYGDGGLETVYSRSLEHQSAAGPIFTRDDITYDGAAALSRIVRSWENGVCEQIFPRSR